VYARGSDLPALHVTRSLGHSRGKRIGVQATPDVCVRKLVQEDRFVIIASQGVWRFLTKQEAVELVGQHQWADDASWELVSEARRRAQVCE
jgi:serine/threonine protein phosphatase PrpC